jgi:hypothetical protein
MTPIIGAVGVAQRRRTLRTQLVRVDIVVAVPSSPLEEYHGEPSFTELLRDDTSAGPSADYDRVYVL